MLKNPKAKGSKFERKAKLILQKEGYYVVKAGASLSLFDLIAFNTDEIKFIQIKTNHQPTRKEIEKYKSFNNFPHASSIEFWSFFDRRIEPDRLIIKKIT